MGKKIARRYEKVSEVNYRLSGQVGWWIDGQHDPDVFCGKHLDEQFRAPDDETAVQTARERAEAFLEMHKKYSPIDHPPKDNEWQRVFNFKLEKIVWSMHYERGKPAQSAIPAKPSKPAISDHIKEIVVSS